VLRQPQAPVAPPTCRVGFERFIDSRVDVGDKAKGLYRNSRDWLAPLLGDRDPHEVTVADIQELIASRPLSPKTLTHYLSTVRQVFDFADVQPNVARSPKVKLPAGDQEEIAPPSGAEWTLIKAQLSRKGSLPIRLKECLALRTKEIRSLTYGDVDFAGERIRVSRARTKRRTAGQRWLPTPPEFLDEIAELCPLEDRRDRRVFPEIGAQTLWTELARACRDAGVAHYPPHQLRHRRCSLWIANGIDEVTAAMWAGHAKASMTLDVYGHVLIDSHDDEWRQFWTDTYASERAAVRDR
jgi:integrase